MHLLGDRLLHDQARAGAADLALVEPDGVDDAFDRAVEIGVVEDDERRLAAELQRQLFAGAGGRLADDAADLGRAGEGDLVDVRMLDDQRAGRAVAGDDVDDAGRQPRLHAELGEGERGQRREFRRLQHHRVSGRERRRDLPGQHQQRKIPRDDLPADADRRVAGELAVDQLRPAGVMIEVADDQRDVDVAALADRLAVVHRLQHGEEALALIQDAGDGIEVAGARVAGERRPGLEAPCAPPRRPCRRPSRRPCAHSASRLPRAGLTTGK